MDPLPQLTAFLSHLQTWLYTLGGTIFIISVVIAGIMRMPLFGVSERRTMISNMALSAAVVGLIIILLAIPLSSALKTIFPTHP